MTSSSTSAQRAANVSAQDMVVGVFPSHPQAEEAVNRLIEAGIPAIHISLVTQGLEMRERLQGFITTGDVARQGAGVGAWTGGLFGLLAGAAFLWAPALEPLIVLGPLVSGALGAAEGGAVGGLLGA
ncbi:MAG TPA: general stress protein, partial [Gemmatimonadales bacterium]|nr:general stress protein [Gemmatimonadales bacterium]